ncbi:hypothetical protein Tco_0924254 [Tanacetum coccineum]|uniref:Retrovirus-related Pol polyprotein from transposon TNT 1-94 n=1 Tax=Tanacetum coccineum TaxID=301880 RepID=A0ABQ5D4Q8_9ASTR
MASDMSKFSIPMFDGKMDFMMWKMTIEDVLVQQGVDEALEEKQPAKMKDDVWKTMQKKASSTIRLALAPEIKYNVLKEKTPKDIWCPQFREDLKSLRDSKGKRKVDGGEMNVVDNGSDEFLMTELNGMGILREKNKVVFGKYQASTHICNDRMASDMSKFSIPMFDGKMDFTMWKMTIEDVFGTTRRKAFSTIRFMSPEIKYIQCFEGEDNRRNLGQAHEYNASKSLTHRLFLKMELYSLKLEEGSNLHDHINSFNPLVCQLANVDDAIKDEEQALLMLSSLPKSYKPFVQTMLTGRTILTFEDVLKVEIPRGSSKGRSKSRMGEDRDMSVVECYYYGDTGHMQETPMDGILREEKPKWVLDNAASSHICNDRAMFETLKRQGTICVKTALNVKYVPGAARNILSLGVLTSRGYRYVGRKDTCKVYKRDQLVIRGRKIPNNLCYLEGEALQERTFCGGNKGKKKIEKRVHFSDKDEVLWILSQGRIY